MSFSINQQLCCNITKNKQCKNSVSENGKCTFHNNRLLNIVNSGICKKLVYDICDGYNNQIINKSRTLIKCVETYEYISNGKYYCKHHYESYKYEKPNDCVICTDTIEYDKETPLHCGHWFHLECLKNSDKIQCPMCRTLYNKKEIEMIHDMVYLIFKDFERENMCVGDSDYDYNNNSFIIKIPRYIYEDETLGPNFIELMYIEIVSLYKCLHLRYPVKLVNNVILNLLKNTYTFELCKSVYAMFYKFVISDTSACYRILEHINFDEDNEHTLLYDELQNTIENMYHSLL
jgi:hypothetical protein